MKLKSFALPLLAAVCLALSGVPAGAEQDENPDRMEFLWACASCHGQDGKGDGEVGKLLTVQVPDLTQLSAANDGTFPMLKVIHIIDGRSGVRGHGTPMPIWGATYRSEIGGSLGDYGAETVVRGRILSLAYYLESIQE
ncbi:c-type cytochrome [Tropicimonas marinistellae]|uniref:c-type cytochrome n=1 Tax=Tropicimonas marinistellae TaxID=1739787 RepID=UPI00082B31D6|nr:c-type cytochrome [Tropicimonas marinistellae]